MNSTDVVMRCSRCYQPIFRDSPNYEPDGTKLRWDDGPVLKHKRCPERPELWKRAVQAALQGATR